MQVASCLLLDVVGRGKGVQQGHSAKPEIQAEWAEIQAWFNTM